MKNRTKKTKKKHVYYTILTYNIHLFISTRVVNEDDRSFASTVRLRG
jgi:hypothetical protein